MRNHDKKTAIFAPRIASSVALAVFPLLIAAQVRPMYAQTSAPRAFHSAEAASDALFHAAQNRDEHQLEAILGVGTDVTSSGDPVQDKKEQEQFTKKYQEMHRLVQETDKMAVLYIGAENWPFPIPLISSKGSWHFDSDAGRQEILFRTLGENESNAIQFCESFASAKKQGNSGNTKAGDVTSRQGYNFQTENTGGRVVLVAFPVKYRSSGVMTFLVTKDGVVYEKDLGPHTATIAPNLKLQTPDSSWHRSE